MQGDTSALVSQTVYKLIFILRRNARLVNDTSLLSAATSPLTLRRIAKNVTFMNTKTFIIMLRPPALSIAP